MTTLQTAIKTLLAADPVLTAAPPDGLGFLVWDRWLVPCVSPGNPPGCTPEAFTDFTQGKRMKRNIVVRDGGDFLHPAEQISGYRRFASYPTIHVFAEAHANGKSATQAALLRIEQLFTRRTFETDAGPVTVVLDNAQPWEDQTDWPGNIVTISRWQATGSRPLNPV